MTRHTVSLALAFVIAASTSAIVDAQGGRGGRVSGSGTNAPEASSSPSMNNPSFPATGLNRPSFPLRGPLGVDAAPPSPFDARPGTYTRLHRIPPSLGTPFGYGYGGPFHGEESTYEKLYRTPQQDTTTGTLFLDVTPATTLVSVDTAYVGSVNDVQARGVTLPAGRHFIDLEAPGFDRKTIEVAIAEGEPLRFRYDLTSAQRAV